MVVTDMRMMARKSAGHQQLATYTFVWCGLCWICLYLLCQQGFVAAATQHEASMLSMWWLRHPGLDDMDGVVCQVGSADTEC